MGTLFSCRGRSEGPNEVTVFTGVAQATLRRTTATFFAILLLSLKRNDHHDTQPQFRTNLPSLSAATTTISNPLPRETSRISLPRPSSHDPCSWRRRRCVVRRPSILCSFGDAMKIQRTRPLPPLARRVESVTAITRASASIACPNIAGAFLLLFFKFYWVQGSTSSASNHPTALHRGFEHKQQTRKKISNVTKSRLEP
jgi:hypothetical protein